jgi:hypothetical protein
VGLKEVTICTQTELELKSSTTEAGIIFKIKLSVFKIVEGLPKTQWRAVHGSKGSIASVVKRRKEKNSYINNSI